MAGIEKHKRVNDILLGPLERPALQWLSAHMPAWVTPDVCTAIGVLGALVTSLGYILSNNDGNFLWLASFGFVVNWFGDSLDGTLARYRHIERPRFGFFIDHTTDAFCQAMIFLGLGLSPYVAFNVASVALIGYLMLATLAYIRTCVVGEFKISYGKLGPTEIRVLAILLNISMYFFGPRPIEWKVANNLVAFSVYDIFVSIIALLLFSFFFNTAWIQGRELAKLGE
ncbi:MAG: CDP-alcohol phosphatidyltransferase family protein [Chloroflexota bacterium]